MQEEGNNYMMSDKEIEKQNFLCWYSMYATTDDIEKANAINKPAMDRLLSQYSQDIEMMHISRNLHEKLF
ncbi:MAG: hypothetical protein SCABRO_02308 [Candidatus Scalindua brodae]|uniref:Uncharacterized protein n=1 Tax=Candidatus Scalindua brodae TaxID=237368 RepID=A0A0B0EH97_9BACT|nr:MAG: hypothetical protein SCABRO_02308 [Candidatus Scalindua brodae]